MYEPLEVLIIIFLVIASISDIRTRTVSNKLILAILTASILYILTAHPPMGILHPVVLAALLVAYKLQGLGGADLKALIPLIFTLSSIQLYFFFVLAAGVFALTYYSYDNRVPFFAALTIAFIVVI